MSILYLTHLDYEFGDLRPAGRQGARECEFENVTEMSEVTVNASTLLVFAGMMASNGITLTLAAFQALLTSNEGISEIVE